MENGGSLFPEALRWLWRTETAQPAVSTKQDLGGDLTLLKLLVEGEAWQVVAEGLGFVDGPCSDAAGNFYFSDLRANQIWKVAVDGTKTKLLDFGAVVARVGDDLAPHLLCAYLFELSQAFSTFYETCPVLKAEGEVRASRLSLCALTLRVIVQGLDLLGVAAPQEI